MISDGIACQRDPDRRANDRARAAEPDGMTSPSGASPSVVSGWLANHFGALDTGNAPDAPSDQVALHGGPGVPTPALLARA